MKIKVVLLDFDGVIVESVGIKDKAFEILYNEYPEHLNEIMKYHLSHNATVRFEKFRYITENILGKEYNENTGKRLAERFSSLVYKEIIACPFVAGAKEFLDYYSGKIPLYLASITPADELDRILEARSLKSYFKRVYAVPWLKVKAIEDILFREGILKDEIVFIGDSYEDSQAASSSGIFFIGRNSGKSFHGADIPVYEDMSGIMDFLEMENATRDIKAAI